ncbi:MAG: hypothetical protein ACK528_04930 [Alphaproteobacteria bacterium]|jgi:hypothetical protein
MVVVVVMMRRQNHNSNRDEGLTIIRDIKNQVCQCSTILYRRGGGRWWRESEQQEG